MLRRSFLKLLGLGAAAAVATKLPAAPTREEPDLDKDEFDYSLEFTPPLHGVKRGKALHEPADPGLTFIRLPEAHPGDVLHVPRTGENMLVLKNGGLARGYFGSNQQPLLSTDEFALIGSRSLF